MIMMMVMRNFWNNQMRAWTYGYFLKFIFVDRYRNNHDWSTDFGKFFLMFTGWSDWPFGKLVDGCTAVKLSRWSERSSSQLKSIWFDRSHVHCRKCDVQYSVVKSQLVSWKPGVNSPIIKLTRVISVVLLPMRWSWSWWWWYTWHVEAPRHGMSLWSVSSMDHEWKQNVFMFYKDRISRGLPDQIGIVHELSIHDSLINHSKVAQLQPGSCTWPSLGVKPFIHHWNCNMEITESYYLMRQKDFFFLLFLIQ